MEKKTTENLDGIEKEFKKLFAAHETSCDSVIANLDYMIEDFDSFLQDLDSGMEEDSEEEAEKAKANYKLKNFAVKLKKTNYVSKMNNSRKDFRLGLSKFSKVTDKNLMAINPGAISLDGNILNQIIAQHFFREGNFEIVDAFRDETKVECEDNISNPFAEINDIIKSLKNFDLAPSLSWTEENSEELKKINSSLEFDLHKLKYIQILTNETHLNAIKYAKEHFHQFSEHHLPEIKRLMTMPLFMNEKDSPYKDLLSENLWDEIRLKFTKDFCSLQGLSSESPLFSSTTVGAMALPTLIKLSNISKTSDWSTMSQLPIEIDVGGEFKYHSIFTCPVSKDHATSANPPILLVCGHVISQNSMEKLSRSLTSRFKCPYCPTDQHANQTKVLNIP